MHLNQVAWKRERWNFSMGKRRRLPGQWFGVLKYICFHWSHSTVTANLFHNIFKTFRLRIDIIMNVGCCWLLFHWTNISLSPYGQGVCYVSWVPKTASSAREVLTYKLMLLFYNNLMKDWGMVPEIVKSSDFWHGYYPLGLVLEWYAIASYIQT